MSCFDELRTAVSQALTRFEVVTGLQAEHEDECLCRRCMFVRGIRAELAAFEKAEKRKRL